ncbi:MAG TPA: hypothetical protein VFW11_07590 [Cyclobacteriaceae bacterium]|nr:hypothetical protein [Cyclobacteriaceae bacterium]
MLVNARIPLIIFSLCIFELAGAQQQQGMNLNDHVLIKMSQQSVFQDAPGNYDGSPYLMDEFVQGEVFINDGNFKGIPLRYNVYKDYVEFKKDNQVYILDPSAKIRRIVMGANILVVKEYPFHGNNKIGFLSMIDSGKATLFSRHVVTYREAQPPKPIETTGKSPRYTEMPDVFYFRIGEGPLKEIESMKKMLEAFPDEAVQLKTFANKEKISVRKKDELVRFFQYYNSL